MRFGLRESDIKYIKLCFQQFPEIEEVLVFGSRAMGNFKEGSDVDLALKGKSITLNTLSRLKALLEEEGPLPYTVDLVHYDFLSIESSIKRDIQDKGVIFNLTSD